MLTVKQIKTLAGRALTDKQIMKGERYIYSGPGMWSNGKIVFCEDVPDLGLDVKPLKDDTAARFKSFMEIGTPAYPVEVAGWEDWKRLIRFTTGKTETWFDGQLVNALIKRAKTGPISFRAYDSKGVIHLSVHSKKPPGMVAPISLKPQAEPDWNFAYTGDLPA